MIIRRGIHEESWNQIIKVILHWGKVFISPHSVFSEQTCQVNCQGQKNDGFSK